jgi:DNA-binding IclR family transcriptional regulator
MACVKPDGTLTSRAMDILDAVKAPLSDVEVAERIRQPLYKARAMLRELEQQGLLILVGDSFRITDAGRNKLAAEE